MLLPNGLLEIGGFQMILSKVERVQHLRRTLGVPGSEPALV
jgi:hypothetical protein